MLGVHADFRINDKLALNRRLNVLIYLNKDWKDEYGGCLEFWNKTMTHAEKSVAPIFNRCVIFNTDEFSYHGHPEPLKTPFEIKRKSIALYYYTGSKKIYEDIAADSTVYKSRPGDGAAVKKQIFRFNLDNKIKDWTPPILFREIQKVRKKFKKLY
jgi:hypothetical protein